MSGRWKTISPSQFPWEQDALDFVQRALPNREPFRPTVTSSLLPTTGASTKSIC